MERATLQIEGMSCGHCVRAVTRALEEVRGVRVERVEVGAAEVSYDAGVAAPEGISAAVEEQGYRVAGVGRAS